MHDARPRLTGFFMNLCRKLNAARGGGAGQNNESAHESAYAGRKLRRRAKIINRFILKLLFNLEAINKRWRRASHAE